MKRVMKMKLSNDTDYAVRVLIYLTIKRPETKSTNTEITGAYQISRNHLTKVIHQLVKIGVITTTRGRGGGITLAQNPKEVTIGSIVRETEENFHMVECFNSENNNCVLTPVCGLKHVLHEEIGRASCRERG